MTPDLVLTVHANPALNTREAVRAYVDQIAADHPGAEHFANALIEVVNTEVDDVVELFSIPEMDGAGFVSSTNGIRLLWMPAVGRAALNAYQGGDWSWTDASSPDNALRRYAEDDMSP